MAKSRVTFSGKIASGFADDGDSWRVFLDGKYAGEILSEKEQSYDSYVVVGYTAEVWRSTDEDAITVSAYQPRVRGGRGYDHGAIPARRLLADVKQGVREVLED